ncbi:MAG TPA: hypothetical protein VMF50_11290 [Candidatus Binataceae bacterium]|nr:hypothetical protein [Candidatus Binataceae bacterium]
MSQTANSSWGARPSKKKAAAAPADVVTLDKFVNGRKEETVRLNVEIPRALRARVKARCALEGREIKDVVLELLQQRFPE